MRTLALTIMALFLSGSSVLAQRQTLSKHEFSVIMVTSQLLCERADSVDEFGKLFEKKDRFLGIVLAAFNEEIKESTNDNPMLSHVADLLLMREIRSCLEKKEKNN